MVFTNWTGDAIKMGEDFGARTIDLEWVQVWGAGLVKPDGPDAKIKFLAAEGLRGVVLSSMPSDTFLLTS